MSRTFAYLRVSTEEQTTDNQRGEIEAAGFKVQARRIISETVSGSQAASQRPGFSRLVDRLEEGDVLVVTKMDRLGRNAIDVAQTVAMLDEMGVRVHCLQLGGIDLTSPTGKLTMGVINTVAEFERDLLIERTNAGLARSRAKGIKPGRPYVLSAEKRAKVTEALIKGVAVAKLARDFEVGRGVIYNIKRDLERLGGDSASVDLAQACPEEMPRASQVKR